MTKRTLSLSILVVFAMIALSACGGISLSTNTQNPNPAPAMPAPTKALSMPAVGAAPSSGASGDLLAAYQGTLENIYSTVSPSVVNIRVVQQVAAGNTTTQQTPGFPFFNLPQGQQQAPQQFQSALGSGFVWDKNGHIVTAVFAGLDFSVRRQHQCCHCAIERPKNHQPVPPGTG